MSKRRLLILLLVFPLGAGVFFFLRPRHLPRDLVQLPVRFFPFVDQPTIKVEIENKKYSLLVDLGSSHPIDLHKKNIQKIKNKKPLEISNYIGIRGKTYPTQAFLLPKIKLRNLEIDGLVGFEENPDFINDSKTFQSFGLWSRFKDKSEFLIIDGRIGWTFFKNGIVVLDFPHSKIVIAKDNNSLINDSGYSLDDFTAAYFKIKKWGLIISIDTDLGSQKFLLDTGATCSIIRASLFTEKLQASKSRYITHKLRIGNNDFGQWSFRLFDYNDQMECDGILGVDFFKKHTICFDFHNQIAYLK